MLTDAPGPEKKPKLDFLGAVLSASGLGLIVFAMLQASIWGWIQPKDSPVEPFGFALTPFVIAAGGVVLWLFVKWQHRREAIGTDPLVHVGLFRITPLRAGPAGDAVAEPHPHGRVLHHPALPAAGARASTPSTRASRCCPVSVAMFLASVAGSRLALKFSTRSIVRSGLSVILVAALLLLWTIQPSLRGLGFAIAMALLGLGMGLIASQVGNVVQSSVDASGRSEAGGLQYTSQQLGSAVGVALIGAIVLSGLTATFLDKVESDPRITDQVEQEATVAVQGGVSFVSTDRSSRAQTAAVSVTSRSEAGGLQYTSQQLGSAVGVALIGAIVLSGLTATFLDKIESDPRITDQVEQQATVAVQGGVSFVSTDTVEQAATDAGLPPDQVAAITENYADSQLVALKVGLLASAAIALGALAATGGLPSKKPTPEDPSASASPRPTPPSEHLSGGTGVGSRTSLPRSADRHRSGGQAIGIRRSVPRGSGGGSAGVTCTSASGQGLRLNGWRGSFRVAEVPSAGCRRSTRRCPPSPSRS